MHCVNTTAWNANSITATVAAWLDHTDGRDDATDTAAPDMDQDTLRRLQPRQTIWRPQSPTNQELRDPDRDTLSMDSATAPQLRTTDAVDKCCASEQTHVEA